MQHNSWSPCPSGSGSLAQQGNSSDLCILSPATRRSYAQKVGEFSAFWQAAGLPEVWPVPVDHLLHFLMDLKDSDRAVSTLSGFMLVIAFVSKAVGCTEYTQDFRVRKLLEGLVCMAPPLPGHRRPVTPDMPNWFLQVFSTPGQLTR